MKNASMKVDKKTAVAIIAAVVCLAIVILSAVIAGHTAYVRDSEAKILNYDKDFIVSSPQILTYLYKDGSVNVDFAKVCEISKGATLSIEKIQDEDMTVTKGEGTVLDLSIHTQRLAIVSVVSKNGVGKLTYRITVVPESQQNNVIDFNVFDGTVDADDVFLHYSGEQAVRLPAANKQYVASDGTEYSFEFLGWYTTESFEEGTEITEIEKGTSGNIEVYAKFADVSYPCWKKSGKKNAQGEALGHWYYTFGNYPQSAIDDFKLNNSIKRSAECAAAATNSVFTYKGASYYKFVPTNVPNLADNGYNANSTYIFKVEPVVWRVLAPATTETAGAPTGRQTLLAEQILNCSAYTTNDATLMKMLYDFLSTNKLASAVFDLDRFIKYFFDGDTVYGTKGSDDESDGFWKTVKKLLKITVNSCDLRIAMEQMGDMMFTAAQRGYIERKSLEMYKLFSSGKDSYDCLLWPLNYSDTINANYGFDPDYRENDALRKAIVTDFAAANGVYIASSLAHKGQGSWWLRGAGGAQGVEHGNSVSGYGYKDKRVAYVKYTGYVHAYSSLNNNIRSGVRPAVIVSNIANISA